MSHITTKHARLVERLSEAHRPASRATTAVRRTGEGAAPFINWLVDVAKARRAGLRSWVMAIGFLAAALIVRLVLAGWLDPAPFIMFFIAVAASTLICGWRQGALVLFLSAIAAWFFLPEQDFSFPVGFDPALEIGRYLLVAALLIVLAEGLVQTVLQLDHTARVNEDLFRELQHRVANNLQIVAATLQKAQRGIQDPVALEALGHAIFRIHSMSGLHRRLYDAAAYSQGLEPILRDVLAEAFRALPVDVRLEIRPHDLSVGKMTAIALLVNEAAINAAKHVFRPRMGAVFEVSLAEIQPGCMQLTIRDDGPGFSPRGPEKQKFGLTVMRGLAEQLGGSLELLQGSGTALRVQFP